MSQARPFLFLMTVLLLAAPDIAFAQSTSPQSGVRSGYVGMSSPGVQIQSSTSQSSSPSSPPPSNTGTGQGRTEGAYGLTPQLQKELGIGRQQ